MAEAFDDPVLGRLEWDEELGYWQGGVDLMAGPHIGISLSAELEELPTALPIARESLAWLLAHEEKARGCVTDEMLESFNKSWRQPGEPKVDRAGFMARIELIDADLGAGGGITLWYSDGDMFGGHAVVADFDAARRIERVTLMG
jgi:hypothetical protein